MVIHSQATWFVYIDSYFIWSINQNDEMGILHSKYTNQAAWLVLGALSSTVNHYPYYFLFTKFFHYHISDPYSTCLNLQYLLPPSWGYM